MRDTRDTASSAGECSDDPSRDRLKSEPSRDRQGAIREPFQYVGSLTFASRVSRPSQRTAASFLPVLAGGSARVVSKSMRIGVAMYTVL
jgi:hypothetical protein